MRITTALLVALALAAAAPAAAKRVVPRGFFGVSAGGVIFDPRTDVPLEFDRMASVGVESVITDFAWSVEQPRPGTPPDFSRTDPIVMQAARHRLPVLAVVVFAPPWGAVDPSNLASPPKPKPYAAYLRAAIGRYGPHGSFWRAHPHVPRDPVRDWQVWNEPSHAGFWSMQPFAKRYVALLRVAHRAIKGADPGARVVLAGLVYDSWTQLRELYAAGAKGYFDAVSLHPYTLELKNVIEVLRRDRAVLDAHGQRRVPMLVTELSWPSSVGHTHSRYGYEVTEKGQAAKLRAAFPRLAALRRRLGIERVYWFSWLTADADPYYPFDYAGLRKLTKNGPPKSKPAYFAYREAALRLEGRRT
jgi:hypothetical protein